MNTQSDPEAFNGDQMVGVELEKLIKRFGVIHAIETGTWSAKTTRKLRKMVTGQVITIDPDHSHLIEEFGPRSPFDLGQMGIRCIEDDSSRCLKEMINHCHQHDLRYGSTLTPILFYLDAHGGGINNTSTNPLREELQQIAACSDCHNNCVIFIHDFLNPKYPDPVTGYGYTWGGWFLKDEQHPELGHLAEPLSYSVLERFGCLPKIFPGGWDYHHNDEAVGTKRGVIYIYPKGGQ